MVEFIPLLMFLATCVVLLAGYPVALSLAGTALVFAGLGMLFGHFDTAYLQALPNRLFGIMGNNEKNGKQRVGRDRHCSSQT